MVGCARRIAHQSTDLGKFAAKEHCRQRMSQAAVMLRPVTSVSAAFNGASRARVSAVLVAAAPDIRSPCAAVT
jgi:hypothetical protein